ncbi:MAG: PAS domain S-box protein [Candidatus Tritonobacter lacicola]|nr:PAS domain S-box protein [Candidatus Tritonobacter lacicola]
MDNNSKKPRPAGNRPSPRGAANEIMNGRGAVLHGIDIINPQYRIEYASRPMLRRYGGLEGKTCYEVYMNRKKPCENCPATEAIKTMKPAEIEFEGRDGRHYIISAAPVKNKDGSVSAIETILDVTERVRREKEQERSKSALQASEKKFKSLIEASSDWVWEVDRNGIYTYASPKVKDLLGYEPEEVVGRTPFDLMPTDEAERIGEKFRDIMAALKPFNRLENVNLHKDGRRVVLETSGVPILDAGGNLLGYRGIDRDISERKKAEEKIEQLSFIVESVSEAVIMTNTDRDIVYANRAAERMLGYTAEEMLGSKASVFFEGVPGNPPNLADDVARQASLQPWEGEIFERRKDGTVFPIQLRMDVVRDKMDRVVGYVGVSQDITERRRAEDELRKFKTISDRANYGTAITDLEGNINYTNEAFALMHGYAPRELINKNLADLHTPEQISDVNRLNKLLLKEGSFAAREVWHKRKDDTVFPTLMNAAIIRNEDGLPLFMAATAVDITELKRAEEASRESEARYKTLYESSRDAIMMLTPEEGFFSGNPATLKMFACKDEEEFTTQTPADLSPEYQPDGSLSTVKAQQMMAVAMENGSNFFEWTHRRLNGENFFATVLLTRVELKGRSFLQATVRDITERKRVEEALRTSEERLRVIIDTVPGVVYTALPDEQSTTTFISANIEEMIGYSPKEMLDDPALWSRLIHPGDRERCWEKIIEHRIMKSPREIEYRMTHKDGRVVHVLDRATPILDDDGNILIIEGIMVDISERKKLQERVVQADKLSAIGEMVAGVAHELNNPLGIISGHIQLLLARVKDRPTRSRLKKMAAHVQRGTTIIQSLLSFSRKGELKLVAGNINETLEKALDNVRSEFPAGRIEVMKNLAEGLPPMKLDHHQMEIVFTNIIKNAFQTLIEAESKKELHLESFISNGTVTIRIRDNGPGAAPSVLANLFDPFFTTKKVGEGSGLGLSIAYGIVKKHGGTIHAASAKDGGLEIIVELPVNTAGRN